MPGGHGKMTTLLDDLRVGTAAALPVQQVAERLGVTERGLTAEQVRERRLRYGQNAVASHRTRALVVLGRQLRSPLLFLRRGSCRHTHPGLKEHLDEELLHLKPAFTVT